MKLMHIVGTRPNFIKLTPLQNSLRKYNFQNTIVHTGQHSDFLMSEVFFEELNIPSPHFFLGINDSKGINQISYMMVGLNNVVDIDKPDGIIIYGDVNSSLAGALVGVKNNIPIFHVESGLRSGDFTMPEEQNRIVIDNIATLLFCTELAAVENLSQSNIPQHKIHLVGNNAIDLLAEKIETIKKSISPYSQPYYFATLHRPFNVDSPHKLEAIFSKLQQLPHLVIIPQHPRWKGKFESFSNILFIEPLSYMNCIKYIYHSAGVITDSGGLQSESCFLHKPLLTIRPTTEHLCTLEMGNKLVTADMIAEETFVRNINIRQNELMQFLWDGNASDRIAKEIVKFYTREI